MVGTARFELATPRTPSECSTRLSHVPTRKEPAALIRGGWGFTKPVYTTLGDLSSGLRLRGAVWLTR